MASISSSLAPNLHRNPIGFSSAPTNRAVSISVAGLRTRRPSRSFFSIVAVAEAKRRIYVGNIPRDVTNDQLAKIFGEHGSVEKAEVMHDKYSGRSRRFGFVTMTTPQEVDAAIEKLNETEIGGRKIKVNVTEKPLQPVEQSLLQAEDSGFVDSLYKVYVGNLAKTVTSEVLKKFFSEKGKVLGAKVSRVAGSSKSSGFGFVTFSSEEEVQAAISSFNNTVLEGQKIRVNKA